MLGIITAVLEEKEAVLKKMINVESEIIYNLEFIKGQINNLECLLVMSGVGKINAAKATQTMICKYNFTKDDAIINVGTSGATNPKLEIGDIVIANKCSQFDVDVTILNKSMGFDYKLGQVFGEDDRFYYTDTNLRKISREIMEDIIANNSSYKIYEAPIVTGDKFENNPKEKYKFFEEFGAYCDEMEGAAVVKTCNDAGVPCIVIRAISDKPEKEEEVMYSEFSQFASERTAEFIEHLTIRLFNKARNNSEIKDLRDRWKI